MEDETVAVKIAFLVLAHGDFSQLERLCSRLAVRGHEVFVHMDAKSKGFDQKAFADNPSVHFARATVPVYWADISMVAAMLILAEMAIVRSFDRYVLLSAADYPVKSIEQIESAFRRHPQKEWISLTEVRTDHHLSKLVNRKWRMKPFIRHEQLRAVSAIRVLDELLVRLWNKVTSLIPRQIERETGLAPWFGNSWWALTAPAMQHVLRQSKSAKLQRAYSSVYACDEQFVHTIIANSSFSSRATKIDASFGSGTNKIAPLHQVHPSEKREFGNSASDFELASSTSKMFIRKVSSTQCTILLDRVDTELLTRVMPSADVKSNNQQAV